jgi:hypothetical protein
MMWAGFFHWKDCFKTFSTAVYFAGLQYTTVGSSLNLPKEWRLLEIMTASAGLLGFAWSTGVLMTLAQEFQEQQLRLLRERRLSLGNQDVESERHRAEHREDDDNFHRTHALERLAEPRRLLSVRLRCAGPGSG